MFISLPQTQAWWKRFKRQKKKRKISLSTFGAKNDETPLGVLDQKLPAKTVPETQIAFLFWLYEPRLLWIPSFAIIRDVDSYSLLWTTHVPRYGWLRLPTKASIYIRHECTRFIAKFSGEEPKKKFNKSSKNWNFPRSRRATSYARGNISERLFSLNVSRKDLMTM